jgi:hypothetical protein
MELQEMDWSQALPHFALRVNAKMKQREPIHSTCEGCSYLKTTLFSKNILVGSKEVTSQKISNGERERIGALGGGRTHTWRI